MHRAFALTPFLMILAFLVPGLSACGEDIACAVQPPTASTGLCNAGQRLYCCNDGTVSSQVPLGNCTETIYSSCFCCDEAG